METALLCFGLSWCAVLLLKQGMCIRCLTRYIIISTLYYIIYYVLLLMLLQFHVITNKVQFE